MKLSAEESTKIHSASELNEMVRQAKSEPTAEFEDDEHTMIGNSQELAARSMSVPDAPPAPRASSNIIRRTGAVMPVRPTSEPPPESDVIDLDEDAAFAPWDDAGQRTSPQSQDQLVAALKAAAPPERIEGTSVETPPTGLPNIEAQADVASSPIGVMQSPIAKPSRLKADRIIAIVAVALLVTVMALGYRRISALENELAARSQAPRSLVA